MAITKKELCSELTSIRNSYPKLSVNELVGESKNVQSASHNAMQVVSELINAGNTSGSISHISKVNKNTVNFNIYQWDEFDRYYSLISSTFESFKSVIKKVERLKNDNSVTHITTGVYCDKLKKYVYFDLEGNAYQFKVNVK